MIKRYQTMLENIFFIKNKAYVFEITIITTEMELFTLYLTILLYSALFFGFGVHGQLRVPLPDSCLDTIECSYNTTKIIMKEYLTPQDLKNFPYLRILKDYNPRSSLLLHLDMKPVNVMRLHAGNKLHTHNNTRSYDK